LEVKVSDNIILIGTAHISKESVEEVRQAIEKYKPAVVAVELCQSRYKALTEKDRWENTPVTQLLKSNRAYLILAQTFLSSIQRRLGKEYGVEPGSEMIAACDEAKKQNLEIALVDRDITITLKRAWRKMGIREKFRIAWEFLKGMVGYDEEDLEDIDLEELMKQDVITAMMQEFGEFAPSAANVLIHERDTYISKKILDASTKGRVVAVVGAGHLNGIKEHLDHQDQLPTDLSPLEQVPKKRINGTKVIAVAIPTIFFVLMAYVVLSTGENAWSSIENLFIWWFLLHGSLAAIGAASARGHPLSIAVAFLAAPFTSFQPFFRSGWLAGVTEAKFRMPLVKDFRELSKIETMKEFFRNKVIHLLMVVALTNVGSIIATVTFFAASPWLVHIRLFG
jgi:pheromone shutdown-related protein TraB